MNNNVVSLMSMNLVFTKIDFAIQKQIAAQFIAQLPSISG